LSSPPTSVSAPTEDRPQRADARRNRGRVVAAARECFAEAGLETQVDDVARRAGVGVGTIYRHFPNKEDLARAVAVHRFQELAGMAASALDEPDPWKALSTFMWNAAELQSRDRHLTDLMAAQPDLMHQAATELTDLRERVGQLVTRAQRAGVLRRDVEVDDVPMIMCGLGRAMQMGPGGPRVSWRRYLALVLDGLRAKEAEPLPDWE